MPFHGRTHACIARVHVEYSYMRMSVHTNYQLPATSLRPWARIQHDAPSDASSRDREEFRWTSLQVQMQVELSTCRVAATTVTEMRDTENEMVRNQTFIRGRVQEKNTIGTDRSQGQTARGQEGEGIDNKHRTRAYEYEYVYGGIYRQTSSFEACRTQHREQTTKVHGRGCEGPGTGTE
ncbi:hypothetical protein K466DRAFT_334008 [Polyporus arcularius HHB13444]|uniref:Uncharacterized protein n=1 Tax=Polyporus arcularius HHB13444 TaxID=1314778 RepID=A0A5C3NZ03_9APHY|nr:hypothetical protein K466DRAFT_334008 [Polyporus arcularius HHB13444]